MFLHLATWRRYRTNGSFDARCVCCLLILLRLCGLHRRPQTQPNAPRVAVLCRKDPASHPAGSTFHLQVTPPGDAPPQTAAAAVRRRLAHGGHWLLSNQCASSTNDGSSGPPSDSCAATGGTRGRSRAGGRGPGSRSRRRRSRRGGGRRRRGCGGADEGPARPRDLHGGRRCRGAGAKAATLSRLLWLSSRSFACDVS